MSFLRLTLEALAGLASSGRSYAHTNPDHLDVLLTEQTAAANREDADHTAAASRLHADELHLQPGLLEARREILGDIHYLEGLLIGARARNLSPDLVEHLAAAVATGHQFTTRLAEATRATITDTDH
ncbi:hypothetical protein [Streptomyces pakalii]|uniref:ANTAR domain-containing protein n=1 Tax=Streptomyces pakalii TaxID=3036494 RepID=A0ABT7DH96_9ACTN|nr:hypothetical protein [Streptomyces pakalii]MDJ1645170.1 hypothetical protein [Streptomyces pakalii]